MSERRKISTGETDPIADQAALWLVRRDRGLTPAEQDEYIHWLTADPRHAKVLAQHAAAFERMMQLYEWQPGQSAAVNPDLFAATRRRQWPHWATTLAAAAAIALGIGLWSNVAPRLNDTAPPRSFLRVNERQALPDGSIVELKDGSQITVAFSDNERRVRLAGEAHFTIAKRARPFLVEVGSVTVQAVGTVFNVRAEADVVDVLVTEGKVKVQRVPAVPLHVGSGLRARSSALPTTARVEVDENFVVAGQRAQVRTASSEEVHVHTVTEAEMEAALAWKVPRLQFFETPLALAIGEFNRWNRVRLVLEQRELGSVPIGGTFRIDNVDGFVRLLEVTLDIDAVADGDGTIILTRKRQN